MTTIQFLNPDQRISGKERRSKLLDPNSNLYQSISKLNKQIINKYGDLVKEQRMDFHIEVLRMNEKDNVHDFLERVKELQNANLDLSNPSTYCFIGNAFSIKTPSVKDYGQTHITIAYFKQKPDIQEIIQLIN